VSWTRRRFLVSTATVCAGAAIARSTTLLRLSIPSRDRVRLLRAGPDVVAGGFERGVRAALAAAAVGVDTLVMPARPHLAHWRELAESLRGGVTVGTASASRFVLVNELIREAGAQLWYQGEHTVDGAGVMRHVSTFSDASTAIAPWLARSTGTCPGALGVALGCVAVGRSDAAAVNAVAFARGIVPSGRSSFVSFVFAT
jgi:hypothetical protein